VVQAVDVMAAQGLPTLVLATGGRTEKAAMRLLPELPEVCFVEVGDFTGAALTQAVSDGLRDVVFVGMAGKLTKLASGVLMTHYTKSKVDLGVLADVTAEAGGDAALVDAVRGANTARHAYELWETAGVLRPAGDLLCARVAGCSPGSAALPGTGRDGRPGRARRRRRDRARSGSRRDRAPPVVAALDPSRLRIVWTVAAAPGRRAARWRVARHGRPAAPARGRAARRRPDRRAARRPGRRASAGARGRRRRGRAGLR
jgi:hypothetical protein